ncbi:isochorismate synthase [Alicyclobacillus kakegawensis]|uniref:isochorismate synthase n=1 Tax=Alicyclobacillus kakegawensis TaxID=392012 RepID=UPI000B17ACB5|nr:isochorismate synthase [Alicyclobacillus kakegawensis]
MNIEHMAKALAKQAGQAARAHPECRLVTVSHSSSVQEPWLPSALVRSGALELEFVFLKPAARFGLMAWGRAATARGAGADRVDEVRAAVRETARTTAVAGDGQPRWLGGFAFTAGPHGQPWQEWPDAELRLPRWLLEWSGDALRVQLTLSATEALRPDLERRLAQEANRSRQDHAVQILVSGGAGSRLWPGGQREREDWNQAVSQTAADIRAGHYVKAVLARSVRITGGGVPLAEVIGRLVALFPEAYVFAMRQGSQWFVGATPERLVTVAGGGVSMDGLAGSIARGRTAEEDERLAQELRASEKNRAEHRAVVDWIVEAIQGVVTDVTCPAQPQIRRLANVQHLYTPIRGRLATGASVFDLLVRLHPTPAVAGVPRAQALKVIARRETFHRGWYAGPIGWAAPNGDGEFAVALRSGLLSASASILFAGAGIMGDSHPDSEWAETIWKLEPMLRALGVSS